MTCLPAMWAFLLAAPSAVGDWTTFGHDPQRTGWASEEALLSPQNVAGITLQWKTKLDNASYSLAALTAPIVATNVKTPDGPRNAVYLAGIGGTVFALDAKTGGELWTRSLRTMALPRKGGLQGTFLCPNGITATPVIDKERGILYVIAPDGSLNGLDLGTGDVVYGPVTFVAPFSKNWSLNLVDGVVYTVVSLGCGNGASGVYAADVHDRHRLGVQQMLLSNAFTAGIWGRGGPVIGTNGIIYGGTADGDTDPATGDYSSTVVGVSAKSLTMADYFLPKNWAYLKKKDLDVGSASPVWFTWNHRNLIAHGFKEGVVYLLDADHLGGNDHQTPLYVSKRLGNDGQSCCAGAGIWGGLSMSRDREGQTWLYVPMGGPPAADGPHFPITNGANPHGDIMAFRVVGGPASQIPTLEPAWISGDFDLPDPAVIANGVLFALATGENPDQRGSESKRLLNTHPAVLKALDARTGKELYNSGAAMTSWVHFSGIAVTDGRVYAVDHDSNVYSFGLPQDPQTTSVQQGNQPRKILGARVGGQGQSSWVGRAAHQDEFLRSWMLRVEFGLGIALFAAIAGIVAAFGAGRDWTRG